MRRTGQRARGGAIGDIILLLALAAVIRFAWMRAAHALTAWIDLGEASHVTRTFAETGVVGDAFFTGQGPTAHMMPTSAVISGGIVRLFGGPDATIANVALASWGVAQVLASFVLLYMLMAKADMDRPARRLGLLLLAVSPTFLAQESADFRVWEGALAVCLAVTNLYLLLTLDAGRGRIGTGRLALAALLAAAAFFVSPPAGLAVIASWGLFSIRRLSAPQATAFAVMGLLSIALVVLPWLARNQAELGHPIALRSDAGLELAVANHPAALDGEPRDEVFHHRIGAIHPFNNVAAAQAVRRLGESEYSNRLGAQTLRWIGDHPADFARLTLRHYRQYYFPERWQMGDTIWRNWYTPRLVVWWAISLLGFASLIIGMARGFRADGYLACYLLVAGLPYAVVQPVPRYSYLVYGVLAMLAVRLVAQAYRRVASKPSIGMDR